jgi:DNA-binding NarL/FixJ family response regulator
MEGGTNRDIALAMGIDEVTVKAHLGRMLRKTRSSNRVELTLRAIEEGIARTRPPSR